VLVPSKITHGITSALLEVIAKSCHAAKPSPAERPPPGLFPDV
jgi:hypothetical protein